MLFCCRAAGRWPGTAQRAANRPDCCNCRCRADAATAAVAAADPASSRRLRPSPASDTRTEVLTLHDIGALGPMTMRGTSAIQGVLLGIKRDEVVTDARLSLTGAMSPSLIPDASNVTVTLNEQYVGTIPVTANHPEFGPLEMPVNPVFFQDRNRLNFRFTGRYTQDCNDPLSGLLWSTVSDKSTLTLTIARLPPRRESGAPAAAVVRRECAAEADPAVQPGGKSEQRGAAGVGDRGLLVRQAGRLSRHALPGRQRAAARGQCRGGGVGPGYSSWPQRAAGARAVGCGSGQSQ